MAVATIHSDFGVQENKVCHVTIVSPSICHEVIPPNGNRQKPPVSTLKILILNHSSQI